LKQDSCLPALSLVTAPTEFHRLLSYYYYCHRHHHHHHYYYYYCYYYYYYYYYYVTCDNGPCGLRDSVTQAHYLEMLKEQFPSQQKGVVHCDAGGLCHCVGLTVLMYAAY
jgi:hypothetical protein